MCGTFGSGLVDFLGLCADTHFSEAVHVAHRGYSWTAPSFTAHHAARISNAYHRELSDQRRTEFVARTE